MAKISGTDPNDPENETSPMTERELGELSVRVTAIEKNLQALASDVREIRDALLTLRGGKRMLVVLIATAASLGAGLATWIPALFGR